MHLGSLESTQEARVALGYRLVQLLRTAALKHGIRNPETETESRKRKRKRIRNLWKKVPSDRFEKKYISNDNKINKQIKKKTQMNKLAE